ncbi:regulator of G-protein signaling 10 [Hyperolius riggenbachi]|uniref:regulator of G-protein signaling 10 n=1 Tax=Hyperolius riggenbachi TaxID=752182 RepID=UPI0035A2F7A0
MFTRAVTRISRKRPPSEIHITEISKDAPEHNQERTKIWSSSLESLLEDPHGVTAFKDFLKGEFSEENLLFWLACEEFKRTVDQDQMEKRAQHIYNTFLSSKASAQVNVEGQSRIGEQILKEPHPLMFEKLQEQIFNLMKYDSYSRFLKSEKFQNMQSSEENLSARQGESAPKRASRIYNT